MGQDTREVRTYMSYGLPIDPAKVFTLVDLDISYALATPLVSLNDAREPISALSDTWDYHGEKEIRFHLCKDAVWSDGSPLTASDVIASLGRAKRLYRKELKSLFDLVESIEEKDAHTVAFHLNIPAKGSGIVLKLTEPMYGILAVKKDDTISFAKTSGPYLLAASSNSEVEFSLNHHWIRAQPNMAERVFVRHPPKGGDLQEGFLKDRWVNILATSSLAPAALKKRYDEAHFSTWNRSLDKVFFLSPGPGLANEEGRELVQFLNKKMDRAVVTNQMSGFHLSDQFFVPGYVLHDPDFKKSLKADYVPEKFKNRPLNILGIEAKLSPQLAENLVAAIKDITGVEPKIRTVPLGELDKARSASEYDFLVGSLPVNDANVEGALGYIFGMHPPFIPNAGTNNFHDRVLAAKRLASQPERNLEYRKVFADAINEGCILPLFHFSTVVLTKSGIDLSMVPTTDETVAFSKVRFK